MKIAMIFTGGTIGSRVNSDGFISNSGDTNFLLLDEYQKRNGKEIVFETYEPYRILSENLIANNVVTLIQTVADIIANGGIDGIIITHGTDTLQYSAALLQYVFGGCKLPILIVSSDYVLTDARANGLINLETAVTFIKEKCGTGVFVAYQNQGDAPYVHRGTRMQKSISYSANVYSILNSWYAKMQDGKMVLNDAYHVKENNQDALIEYTDKLTLKEDTEQIIRIKAIPGIKYPEITAGTKAVIYESYHSGTICIDSKLEAFAKCAKEKQVPIFLIGLMEGEAEYETVEMYRKMGVISIVNRSAISQYCKLWLLISNGLPLLENMEKSIAEDWCK